MSARWRIWAVAAAFAYPIVGAASWAADAPGAPDASPASAQPASAPAEPELSLMFSPEEISEIRRAADERGRPAANGTGAAKGASEQTLAAEVLRLRVPNIYVSAVVDYGDGDWTVWANGLRITPTQQPPLFHVAAVQGNSVDIVVVAEDNIHVRLQPYQTWRSVQRDVIEGIVP